MIRKTSDISNTLKSLKVLACITMAATGSGDWYEHRVDNLIRTFAHDLQIPSYRETGRAMIQKIIDILKSAISRLKKEEGVAFSLSETVYGGSYAKGTDVMAPDFDLVFRMKNVDVPKKPDVISSSIGGLVEEMKKEEKKRLSDDHTSSGFAEVISYLKNILEKHAVALKILQVPIQTTRRSLQFCLVNGIKVDLLIATSIKDPEEVMAKIKTVAKNKALMNYYSTSLVESQVKMIAVQSDFSHKVMRLVKLWKSQCDFGNGVRGMSTIMELIALAAALEEQKKPEKHQSIVQALIRVFEMVEKLNSLKLAFRNWEGAWKRVKPEALAPGAVVSTSIVGLPEMLTRPRLIIEPTNPYNDLLEGFSDFTINKIMEYGRIMKERLNGLSRNQKYCTISSGTLNIQFEKLFEPMPLVITEIIGGNKTGLPVHVYVTHDSFQHRRDSRDFKNHRPTHYLDMKIRRHEIFTKPEILRVLELIKIRLLGLVTCATGGLRNVSKATSEETLELVGKILKTMLPSVQVTAPNIKQTPLGVLPTLDAFDITLSMPYSNAGDDDDGWCYGIRISLKWGT